MKMKTIVFAYSRGGCETAARLLPLLPADTALYCPARMASPPFQAPEKPDESFYGACFAAADALIFVGAAGIAVRMIAPHLRHKSEDCAVLVIDERGRFVIPILSGHIGGANALAAELADALGATAVITTATDVNGRFSVDAWAARQGYAISDMELAKRVSAAILEGDVAFQSDFPVKNDILPAGLAPGGSGALGVAVTVEIKSPFARTLRLIPRAVRLGVGCRRGADSAAIRALAEEALSAYGIDKRAVKEVATIDLKKDEPGLLSFCRVEGWPLRFYSAEELRAAEGEFTASAFVESVTGVDNVCERAALREGGRLLIPKQAKNGVTVAAAIETVELSF